MFYGTPRIERPAQDTLATAVDDADDVEWRFTTEAMWKRGDLAELYDGTAAPEVVYITEDHPSGADITVRRQQRNTSGGAAYAAGDVFIHHGSQASSVTQVQMERAINETINNDLWPQVWYLAERTLAGYSATDYAYDLAATDMDILKVYQYNLNSSNKLHPFPRGWWDTEGSINTAVGSTGRLLRLYKVIDTTASIYYTVRAKPLSSGIASLPSTITDIVPYGAVSKLLGIRGSQNAMAPKRRKREEQDPVRDSLFFRQEFERMRDQERERLLRDAPPMGRFIHDTPRVG